MRSMSKPMCLLPSLPACERRLPVNVCGEHEEPSCNAHSYTLTPVCTPLAHLGSGRSAQRPRCACRPAARGSLPQICGRTAGAAGAEGTHISATCMALHGIMRRCGSGQPLTLRPNLASRRRTTMPQLISCQMASPACSQVLSRCSRAVPKPSHLKPLIRVWVGPILTLRIESQGDEAAGNATSAGARDLCAHLIGVCRRLARLLTRCIYH